MHEQLSLFQTIIIFHFFSRIDADGHQNLQATLDECNLDDGDDL